MCTDNTSCICGKTRSGLNRTNWQRHLNSCKKRKLQFSACSISKFLVGSTKEFIVSKDDQLSDTTGKLFSYIICFISRNISTDFTIFTFDF